MAEGQIGAAWRAFVGTAVRPRRTFDELAGDPQAARHGALILAAFLSRGYPAVAGSVLGLAPEDQYHGKVVEAKPRARTRPPRKGFCARKMVSLVGARRVAPRPPSIL